VTLCDNLGHIVTFLGHPSKYYAKCLGCGYSLINQALSDFIQNWHGPCLVYGVPPNRRSGSTALTGWLAWQKVWDYGKPLEIPVCRCRPLVYSSEWEGELPTVNAIAFVVGGFPTWSVQHCRRMPAIECRAKVAYLNRGFCNDRSNLK